ncbi:MAG: hypothetical protein K2Q21_11655 [Chitinophagaceae bacterium]|nr:hypothetical protein [Chitinophagaceae bacterium]
MNKFSRNALLAGYCLILFTGVFYYPKWKQPATEATLSWDVSGYYLYLPAIFIYHDLKQCKFKDSVLNKYRPTPDFQQAFQHSSGNYILKYTAGQAILLSPFFFAAHIYATVNGTYLADGFSYPYQISIGVGMLLYAFIGLWFLRKILLRYFTDLATALSLFVIVFASNYLDYSAIDGAMTHNGLFTIYAALIFCCFRFYEKPTLQFAAVIGFLAGMATLTRPTEVISLLLPLLWGIKSRQELKLRIRFLKNNSRFGMIALAVFVLIVSIQFIYWKWVSGQWIIYTYGEEGFDWLHPHFINALISFKGGWFIYSPAMILTIIGFVYLFRYYRQLFYSSFIFILCFCYICFSWKEWWYGASLGQRAMIQAYPVLAIPLTALFERTFKRKLLRLIIIVFIVLCTYYNFWLTHQAHKGGLFRAGEMNAAFLMATIGRYHVPRDVETLLDNTERYTGQQSSCIPILKNTELITLGKDNQTSKEIFFTAPPDCGWIRASAEISTAQKEWDMWKMPQFIIKFYRNNVIIKSNFIRVSRLISDGETRMVHIDARIPEDHFDRISISFWNAGSDKQILFNKINVLGFTSK